MQWWQSGWWAVGAIFIGALIGAAVNRRYDKWANRQADKRAAKKEQRDSEFRNTVSVAAADQHAYVLMLGQAVGRLSYQLAGMMLGLFMVMFGDASPIGPTATRFHDWRSTAFIVVGTFIFTITLVTFSAIAWHFLNVSNRALFRKSRGNESDARKPTG